MGSGYFGEPNLGSSNERGSGSSSSSSSSSSRKGKKSNSDKPRQPQRGLGVAQLEKIRLHGQIGCAYVHPPPLHNPYSTNFNINDDHMRMQTAYSAIPSSSFSYSSSSTSSSATYGFNPSMMMGLNEYERANLRYSDSQPTTTRWDPNNATFDNQYITQPNMTRHLLNLHIEDSQHTTVQPRSTSTSQNSESSDTQDLDLELRLSL